jgi:tol-pal system protein YbgF
MRLIKSVVILLTLGSFSLAFADAVPIEDLSQNSSNSNIPVVPLSDSGTTNKTAATGGTQQVSTSSWSIDQRVSRLEQQAQAQSQLAQQVDQLQQQVQSLQGQVDEQTHQLQQLREQLNNFYADVDQRISGAKGKTPVITDTTQAPAAAKNAAVSDQEQQAYDTAFNLLKDGKYDQAVPKFKDYIKTYPNGKYVANSHYWLGEIYYLQSDLKNALSEFQTVAKTTSSPKVPDAMFKIALIHYDQGLYTMARKEFTNIKKTYPNTSVARLADQQLKKMNSQQV